MGIGSFFSSNIRMNRIKQRCIPYLFCLFFASFFACGDSQNDVPTPPEEPKGPNIIEGINAIVQPSASFAKDDGAITHESPAELVSELLVKAGPEIIKGLGYISITQKEYQEIKDFTDQLVKEVEKPFDIYSTIFKWVVTNVKYTDGVNNDPYPVFKNRQGICQGYANLLSVMLHTQNIPVFIANGMLNPVGGHAWNYVYIDQWYVSDPTNNGHFLMSEPSSYVHLVPLHLDVNLFEDEQFVFNFNEGHLNLREVKKSEKQLIVPFSTNGFQITSFNPDSELPSNIEEIYIGKNIQTLGENLIGLSVHAPNVKHAFVDTTNKKMESYGQLVYRYSFTYYVPASATIIQFKDYETLGKNILHNHPKVETVVIQQGTKKLEAYAFENCPNLQKAYIPEGTTVDANAFYGVHSNFKIIRGIVKN